MHTTVGVQIFLQDHTSSQIEQLEAIIGMVDMGAKLQSLLI